MFLTLIAKGLWPEICKKRLMSTTAIDPPPSPCQALSHLSIAQKKAGKNATREVSAAFPPARHVEPATKTHLPGGTNSHWLCSVVQTYPGSTTMLMLVKSYRSELHLRFLSHTHPGRGRLHRAAKQHVKSLEEWQLLGEARNTVDQFDPLTNLVCSSCWLQCMKHIVRRPTFTGCIFCSD